jgi:hypothetical protein
MLTVADKETKERFWLVVCRGQCSRFLLVGTVYFNNIPEIKDVRRKGIMRLSFKITKRKRQPNQQQQKSFQQFPIHKASQQ